MEYDLENKFTHELCEWCENKGNDESGVKYIQPILEQEYIHIPTGRPMKVVAVAEDSFIVHTLDDVWLHPKTGNLWGGSSWVLELEGIKEFKIIPLFPKTIEVGMIGVAE